MLAVVVGAAVGTHPGNALTPTSVSDKVTYAEDSEDATADDENDDATEDADADADGEEADGEDEHQRAHQEIQEGLNVSLVDARASVRESVLKLAAGGKTVKEIQEAGYTRDNLGCKRHANEAEALERCLKGLKEGFTPEQLLELLDLKSEHSLGMLAKTGLTPKTSGWEKGKKVLFCWAGDDDKSGCQMKDVFDVDGDKVQIHHLEFDGSTGTAEKNGYKFTVYSLKEWAEEKDE